MLLNAGLHVPEIPLLDTEGSENDSPEQIAETWVNTGVVLSLTVTVIVVVPAHCPAFGVNVYVVVTVLLIAGLHVPMIPLEDVVGSENEPPEQIAGTCVKVGIAVPLFTVTVMLVAEAHCPVFGVNVYVVVAVLLIAGLHAPVIPLDDVVGSENASPEQIAGIWLNVGVVGVVTVTVIVVVVAHSPAFGVNVYVVVVMLFTAGLHVPEIPLEDVAGSDKLLPEQTAGICVNVGVC